MSWIKQYRIVIIISFILAVLIVKLDLPHALLLFLFMGIVPATNFAIPPFFMACGVLALAWFVIVSFVMQLHHTEKPTEEIETKTTRLPRRRYAR